MTKAKKSVQNALTAKVTRTSESVTEYARSREHASDKANRAKRGPRDT